MNESLEQREAATYAQALLREAHSGCMTAREVAGALQKSREHVRRFITSGQLPAHRDPEGHPRTGAWHVLPADLGNVREAIVTAPIRRLRLTKADRVALLGPDTKRIPAKGTKARELLLESLRDRS